MFFAVCFAVATPVNGHVPAAVDQEQVVTVRPFVTQLAIVRQLAVVRDGERNWHSAQYRQPTKGKEFILLPFPVLVAWTDDSQG